MITAGTESTPGFDSRTQRAALEVRTTHCTIVAAAARHGIAQQTVQGAVNFMRWSERMQLGLPIVPPTERFDPHTWRRAKDAARFALEQHVTRDVAARLYHQPLEAVLDAWIHLDFPFRWRT